MIERQYSVDFSIRKMGQGGTGRGKGKGKVTGLITPAFTFHEWLWSLPSQMATVIVHNRHGTFRIGAKLPSQGDTVFFCRGWYWMWPSCSLLFPTLCASYLIGCTNAFFILVLLPRSFWFELACYAIFFLFVHPSAFNQRETRPRLLLFRLSCVVKQHNTLHKGHTFTSRPSHPLFPFPQSPATNLLYSDL